MKSTKKVIRDHFWIWSHQAGSYNHEVVLDGTTIPNWYNLPQVSRMTPVECAYYLGIPNVIMVRYRNKPEPPYDLHARSFRPLKQVVWSIIGDGGCTLNNNAPETDEVIRLAGKFPNITGVVMDDTSPGRLSIKQLIDSRKRLKSLPRPLDLWIVGYMLEKGLMLSLKPYFEQCDVVTLWTWKQEEIVNLPTHLERNEALIPDKRKVLGCYMYDFGNRKPMLVENMQRQCELGLHWLKEGRIEGMIFCGNCVADLDFEAVEWTRKWISDIGDKTL